MTHPSQQHIAIIGGGPAGLMAAEVLANAGHRVDVFDAMPSVGRKFLLAGVGGMNITHSEPLAPFLSRYAERETDIAHLLADFSPADLCDWIHGLGIQIFVGSSGRVFPTDMKAAPLLRAWLHRLKSTGVQLHVRHRWLGWDATGALRFTSPAGETTLRPAATVLALGGGSWARLGSDGSWLPLLAERGIETAPLQPSNCGFDVGWSTHLREKFAGAPLKSVALAVTDIHGQTQYKAGEFVISETGVEGSLIYAFAARVRQLITTQGTATILLDLLPNHSAERVLAEVTHPRGSRSLSSHLQSRLGLTGVKASLLRECLDKDDFQNAAKLAVAIKALPIVLKAPRPIDEAISTAGGVRFEALDTGLMLKALPGVFCAGEMLDWEAPTGGYLLTACFASGRAAGLGVQRWLADGKTDLI
ncbi:TIGR03862 family flavoprotein [Chitinimonas sp. PSY-7]|uniref:TIGR03862 family flavoprotein n=1 Tax=Chitinimonas sp. PSY-7 TaxID=3459088 RepID=UPI00403FF90D